MKRAATAFVLLLALSPLARADEESGTKKLFGGMLKRVKVNVGGKEYGVNERQLEGATKTVKAFRKSAEEISESEERFIGRAVSAQLLSRYKPYDDEALNGYLQSVLQAVAGVSDRPEIGGGWHAQALDSDEVNAFAAPGGFVLVTTGLLKKLKSEDELAGVLAHEAAHVCLKHGLKTIKASRLTKAFSILGAEAAKEYSPSELKQLTEVFGGAVDDVVNDLVVKGYSRDKEYEADKKGAAYARAANYDPEGLSRSIEALGGAKGGLLKTHPGAKQRLKELESEPVSPSEDYRESAARQKRFEARLSVP